MNFWSTKKLATSTILATMLLTSFGTTVGAEEREGIDSDTSASTVEVTKTVDNEVTKTVDNDGPKTLAQLLQKEETEDITSTNDERRTNALEKEYNIKLEESDNWTYSSHWSEQTTNYTPMNVLKQMGYFHINANRQSLILYAIRTSDWQPYRAYEAKNTPLYFEIVDGKFEYSKIYFGYAIEKYILNNQLMGIDLEKPTTDNAEYVLQLKSYIAKFKAAPGIVPYVIGLNHRDELAIQYDVEKPKRDYFDSKYNNPKVMQEGKFE